MNFNKVNTERTDGYGCKHFQMQIQGCCFFFGTMAGGSKNDNHHFEITGEIFSQQNAAKEQLVQKPV